MKISWQTPDITVFESSLYRTTSTIVDLGTSLLIVDPNWLPIEIDALFDYVTTYHQGKKQYLIFTHSDYDHTIGAGQFAEATIIASEAFATNEAKEKVISQIKDFDDEYYITRTYPIKYPNAEILIKSDRQKKYINETEIVFFLSPGHTSDGLFIIIPKLKLWIAGDYLSNIEIPIIDHDYQKYQETLDKTKLILDTYGETSTLIPGHGDVADSVGEIKRRIENDMRYLELLQKNIEYPNIFIENEIQAHLLLYSSNPTMKAAHQKNLSNSK